MPAKTQAEDVAIVWYVESGGATWDQAENYEFWLVEPDGEILARAGSGVLACALTRRSAHQAL